LSHAEEIFRTWTNFLSSHNVQGASPWSEQQRLLALANASILDTPAEPAFDELAALAAQLCGAPMAQINFIDATRQWSKSQYGLAEPQVLPRDESFCAQAIYYSPALIVDDLSVDSRFATHAQVAGGALLRFYAGTVLLSADGLPLGALCVLDVQPRQLTEQQKAGLAMLARQVMSQLELRRALLDQRDSEVRQQLATHRQAFLLQLSDRLHDTVRAEDVVLNLGESLGSTLNVQRLGYGRFDLQGQLSIESEWLQGWAPSSRGVHAISEYGEGLLSSLSQGELVTIEDVLSDPRTANDAGRYADFNVRSVLMAPLADNGQFNSLLYISCDQPRQWADEDVALVREVADRIRGAEERAKAHNALLEADQRVTLANSIASVGVWEYNISRNSLHFDAQSLVIAGLPAEQIEPTVEDFLSVVHADDRSALVQAVAEALDSRSSGEISLDFRVQSPAGGMPSWLTLRGRRMRESDGTLRLIGNARDITVERNGEESLRRINAVLESQIIERARGERLQAALLILGDLLREKTACSDIRQAASSVLGMTLGVERVAFASVGLEREQIEVRRDWVLGGAQSIAGSYRIAAFGSLFDTLQRGESVVINDTELDSRTAQGDCAAQADGVRALINIPLLEQGLVTTLLLVHASEPRVWSDEEVGFIRDVADRSWAAMERARAEGALRASELQFRTLADNMSQLAWTAEPSGKIYWYNKRWYDYTGTSLEAMQALGWRSVHHPEHFERVTARVRHCFATGSVWEDTFPLRGKDGNYSWFLSRALPIRDAQGHVIHWLGTHTDITAQVNAEEALRDLNESLELRVAERTKEMVVINELLQVEMSERESAEEALRHAQKMDAIGQLTGGIAHDFNNMLTGVLGALDLIQRRVAAGRVGEIDRYISAAMTSANRAASLTHRLLAFARRQSLNPQAVDVNRMVTSMEELLRRTIGESIELHIDLQERLWQANTDEHQLENALLNLVINARDAMPDGGRLTIRTAVSHVERQEEAVTPGEYVLLTVEDSGFGMSSEIIGRAFDPFFTTKPIGQGTGLGLSMVYGFVKQTGGHVLIDSVERQGTCVRLYLPCHLQQGERHVAETDSPTAPRALSGEQVLVVEDEVAVRMLVVDVLRELGYTTLEASDSKTALPILQSAQRIDLLVSDVGLPGLNGRQLAEIARQHRPDLRVLFMTGYARTAEVRADFLDPGMDMLIKPFSIDELALKVRKMIEAE
jgi:PAS domain S-box-containing protein